MELAAVVGCIVPDNIGNRKEALDYVFWYHTISFASACSVMNTYAARDF